MRVVHHYLPLYTQSWWTLKASVVPDRGDMSWTAFWGDTVPTVPHSNSLRKETFNVITVVMIIKKKLTHTLTQQPKKIILILRQALIKATSGYN